jgi:methyl-accepting chemotaxis protein
LFKPVRLPQEDKSRQYNIAFSEPIRDPGSHEVVGVWINILNGSYLQNVLDNVETDLAAMDLLTGYGFMASKDASTIIGHRNRLNPSVEESSRNADGSDYFDARLIEDYGLGNLGDAILNQKKTCEYTMPNGDGKIAGLAPISDTSLGWVIGVEIDGADVFRPVKALSYWLLGVTVLLALLVVLFTYLIAEGITVPLKTLIRSALTIAQGNFNQRVPISSSDELGILAATFNEMARALSLVQLERREPGSVVRDRTLN